MLPYASYSPSSIPAAPHKPSAVGSIRLDLTKAPQHPLLTALITTCISVNSNETGAKDKALKKALGKELSKNAHSLLDLIGDSSVCLIEVALPSECILSTDGLICACFLDAGAQAVVIEAGDNLSALEASRIPADRVTASCAAGALATLDFSAVSQFATTISVTFGTASTTTTPTPTPAELRAVVPASLNLTVVLPSSYPGLFTLAALRPANVRACIRDVDTGVLGKLFASCATTDRADGLYTTVVTTRSGVALGLVYSSVESIAAALESGRGVYYSRSRNGLWRKGDTSGCYQVLHRMDLDCDGDALRVMVTQMGAKPAFCHLETLTCWGEGVGVNHLEATLTDRLANAPQGSYTKRLFEDEGLLKNKLLEESLELLEATEPSHVAAELADVLYFAMVRAVKAGVSIDDAVRVLDERSRKVTRRPGNDKKERIEEAAAVLKK
jgi:phosphoribosyl-ATP pyrophosphohydrolase/phosphoribosyl-AMP cyclohydrolase/histidinol dehydrogenase